MKTDFADFLTDFAKSLKKQRNLYNYSKSFIILTGAWKCQRAEYPAFPGWWRTARWKSMWTEWSGRCIMESSRKRSPGKRTDTACSVWSCAAGAFSWTCSGWEIWRNGMENSFQFAPEKHSSIYNNCAIIEIM